jgi:hypothetical protein
LKVQQGIRAGAALILGARLLPVPLALAGLLTSGALPAAPPELERFFGAYVGVATVEDIKTGEVRQRDMDIVIEPYRDDGFAIRWINVTLVDGRRDLPGVERRVQNVLFEQADERDMYVEVSESNPFREREETRPMRGDPVRWASLDGDTLHVYAFVVAEDGTYELQIYDRVLTEKGIDIEFQRIVDDEVLRRITGTTARAE